MSEASFDEVKLQAAISALGLGVDAPELHGGICGLLCTRGPGAVATWIRASGHTPASPNADSSAASASLHDAEAEAWRALNGPSMSFYPMLPDSEAALVERVAGLASWCQGFVTGLALGGYSLASAALDDDAGDGRARVAEVVADLLEISRAGVSEDDLGSIDRAGFDLAALVEYVRVGAQLVFEELSAWRERAARPSGQTTRH